MTAAIDVTTITSPRPEPARDRWGRYLITPPGGGTPVPYTRATTVAKTLEDQHSLIAWKARVTAKGLTLRPELLKMIAVTDDRKQLDDLCEQAAASGGATERRDEGTALHRALEYAFNGQPAPPLFAADIEAVLTELRRHNLTVAPDMTERIAVHDQRRIAGTFDCILTDNNGRLWIADIKTGASLDYSGIAFAVQLAIYAGADNLLTDTGSREPLPAVSRDTAIVIHVQPNTGRCQLHDVDIAAGAELLEQSIAVRAARSSSKRLLTPRRRSLSSTSSGSDDPEPDNSTRRDNLAARANRLKTLGTAAQELAATWPAGVPGLKTDSHTNGQLDQIEAALTIIETRHMAPFDPPPQPEPAAATTAPTPPKPAPPDEGCTVTPEEIAALSEEIGALPPRQQAWIRTQVAAANTAGHRLNLRANPTQRRWVIADVLRHWAGSPETLQAHLDNMHCQVWELSIEQALWLIQDSEPF